MFYCSSEYPWPGLPVECRLVRYLSVGTQLERAAVVEACAPIFNRGATFVALVKGNGLVSDVDRSDVVSVFLLEVDERVVDSVFHLEKGLQPVLDWGVLTNSATTAERWQVR